MRLNEPYETRAAGAPLKGQPPEPQIIMSSRVRLARNLRGERFPDWASERERVEVLRRVGAAAVLAAEHPDAQVIPMEGIDGVRMEKMRERSLISRDLVDRGVGAGVVYVGSRSLSVMINEEDHIRIQAFEPGLGLTRAWEIADAFDTRLEKLVPYAFSERLGYLTACPSNIGTGMRASVMVHLPGLRLSGDLEAVIRGLERLRLTVRGIGGEGSAASGHRFQISNQGTLGLNERAVITSLERVAVEVARQEVLARKRVLRDMPVVVKDCVARALAILQHAHLIQADEALDYLSAVRMGIEMGVIQDASPEVLEPLEMIVHPGHLQDYLKEEMDPEQRDLRRADLLRERLACWTVNEWLVRKARKRLIVKEKK
jgi:protein arginine kinase